MTEPYYDDGRVTLYLGHATEIARDLPDASVDCIVTSPPYWGLRDYGHPDQLGSEPTVDEFIGNLVVLFRELRRLLADDGTMWLNLGDTYATRGSSIRDRSATGQADTARTRRPRAAGFSTKQLLMIPARVAIALQADGWILRSEIVWHKPNPMPESITDRPTKAHEMLYLFSKSDRYFYDAEAIAEPIAEGTLERLARGRSTSYIAPGQSPQTIAQPRARRAPGPRFGGKKYGDSDDPAHATKSGNVYEIAEHGMRNARDVWTIPTQPFAGAHFAVFPDELPRRCIRAGARPAGPRCDCDMLVQTPTGAGGSIDPTVEIGRAGIARPRQPDEGRRPITRREQRGFADQLRASARREEIEARVGASTFAHYIRTDRTGARPLPADLLDELVDEGVLDPAAIPACAHPSKPAGVVLDPFSGSGTTGRIALLEGHRYIGFELNREYLDLSLSTRFQQQPLDLGGLA